jgi:hypothetical protein
MDLSTHAALGAAGAAAAAPSREMRIAALAGAVAGLLFDTDALIESASDRKLTPRIRQRCVDMLLGSELDDPGQP